MRTHGLAVTLAGTICLAGCATYDTPPASRSEANAALASGGPASSACGTYGLMDRNGDGHISRAEWDAYRAGAYSAWDTNHDGRISREEFQNCWNGNGFYAPTYYNRDYWTNYYNAFDPDHTGYINQDQFFGDRSWNAIDRNGNGVIDDNEWTWWSH